MVVVTDVSSDAPGRSVVGLGRLSGEMMLGRCRAKLTHSSSHLHWAALGIVASLSLSCGPRAGTIHGQAFIVTQVAVNVRLGLVTVELLTEDAARRHVAQREEAYQREVASIRANNEQAVHQAKSDYERALESEKDTMALLKPELSRARVDLFDAKERYEAVTWRAGLRDSTNFVTELDVLRATFQRATRRYEALRSRVPPPPKLRMPDIHSEPRLASAFYFSQLPAPIATTQTDAEGRFSLAVPKKGRFVLTARASRLVPGSETESYFWLVQLPRDSRDGAPVLLSNTTLTTARSPLSLVHTEE